jgi:hypothetical protein
MALANTTAAMFMATLDGSIAIIRTGTPLHVPAARRAC